MRAELETKIKQSQATANANLENMNIRDDEIKELLKSLQETQPHIAVINLDSNQLTDQGALLLTEEIKPFHQLRQLSLQFNDIGRAGAISIFSLKKEIPTLDILFRGNQISDVGEMADIERIALSQQGCNP